MSVFRRNPVRRRDTSARKRSQPVLGRGLHSRSIRRAWRQFHEGSLSHWITTVVIALSLTIYGVFALLLGNAGDALEAWRGDDTITVFLKPELAEKEAQAVRERLVKSGGVNDPRVVPPTEAVAILKERLGSEAGLLDELNENPLPYTVEFKMTDDDSGEAAAVLATQAGQWQEVEAVSYDRQWADRLSALVKGFRYGGLALSFLLLSAVALIISNTIKLTIIARKEEVEVMRFMGATNAFIQTPFVYEGILQGLLGSLLSLLIIALLFLGAREVLADVGVAFGLTVTLEFLHPGQMIFILALGIFLGLVGALISISRFLEV